MSRFFDGVDDLITVNGATLDSLTTFTWCAWINAASGGEFNVGRIATKGSSGVDRKQWLLQGAGVAPTLEISITTSGTGRGAVGVTGAIQPYGTWNFVAVSYVAADGGPRLWAGTLTTPVAELSYASRSDGTGTTTAEAGGNLLLGNRIANDRTFHGLIKDFSLWPSVLTVAQLDRLRGSTHHAALAAEFAKTCALYLRMAESELAADLSGNGYHGVITGAVAGVDPPLAAWRDVVATGIPHALKAA